MSEWELFKSYLDYVKSHYDSMETWEDNDKLQEAIDKIRDKYGNDKIIFADMKLENVNARKTNKKSY